MNTLYKDESIFQGIKEFETPQGRVRVVKDGVVQHVFVKEETGFVMVGTVSKNYRTPTAIYKAMENAEMFA